MSTQEERRQAIGKANTAERQAIGQRIRDDLNRSLRPEPPKKKLPELPSKGALGVLVGVGAPGSGSSSPSGGGGIASPLTEGAAGGAAAWVREFHPSAAIASSDGLFTLIIQPLKRITLRDADGAPVVIDFAAPPAEDSP